MTRYSLAAFVGACLALSVAPAHGQPEISGESSREKWSSIAINGVIDENVVWSFEDVVVVEGTINEEMYEKIREHIDKHTQFIVISSAGGEEKYAIKIGQLIYSHRLDIVVQGVCLSSCANFLFPAAREKIVLENSVVGWHSGDYHFWNYYKSIGDEVSARRLWLGVKRGMRFYRRIGVDYDIIRDAGSAVGLLQPSLVEEINDTGASREYLIYQSKFDIWVPPPDEIAKYGIALNSENYWYVADPDKIAEILSSSEGDHVAVTIEPVRRKDEQASK